MSVLVIGGVFVMVLKANHDHSTKANLTAANSVHDKGTLSSNAKPQSKLSTTASTSNSAGTPAAVSLKSATTSTKSSSTTSSKSNATSSGQSTSSPATTSSSSQTPLSVLTALITNLDNGAQVNVTASVISVPGPITTAQARPIVFTANGQVYFAYTQGHAPNFTTSPSQTANTMAVVNATISNPPLEQAHLDKAGNLVDPDISGYLVGYSTGGD